VVQSKMPAPKPSVGRGEGRLEVGMSAVRIDAGDSPRDVGGLGGSRYGVGSDERGFAAGRVAGPGELSPDVERGDAGCGGATEDAGGAGGVSR
jgi:hypothetical protein